MFMFLICAIYYKPINLLAYVNVKESSLKSPIDISQQIDRLTVYGTYKKHKNDKNK